MKKTPKQATLQTLDKKIDTLITTVDNLAIATKRGFDNTVSKTEFTEFKSEMTEFKKNTERTLFNLDSHARTANERLDAIEKTLEPLIFVSGAMQRELREHERRISHVERKVGVVIK